MGNVVLLSDLIYSAAGEILCCNIYGVAIHAAIELGAEKLICLTQQASRPYLLTKDLDWNMFPCVLNFHVSFLKSTLWDSIKKIPA